MTFIKRLFTGMGRIGRRILDSAPVRKVFDGMGRIGKPLLNGVGKVIGVGNRITKFIDDSPLGGLIQATPFGGIYNAAKKGLSIADELRQGGDRVLNGENIVNVGRDVIGRLPGGQGLIDRGQRLLDGMQNRARDYGQQMYNDAADIGSQAFGRARQGLEQLRPLQEMARKRPQPRLISDRNGVRTYSNGMIEYPAR